MASNKQKKKEKYTLKELKLLGHDLLTSRSHINNLPLLLSFVSPESPPQFVVESLLSLQSFFTPLLSQLPSTSSSPSSTKRPRSQDDDPEVVFKAWLRSKFDEFFKLLLDVLVSQQSEDSLRVNFFYLHCVIILWFRIALFVLLSNVFGCIG